MHPTPSLVLCIALSWTLFVVAPAHAQLRIYTDADRFEARTEAREKCQPLVVLFYNSTLVRFNNGQWVAPQGRIELFFDSRGWERKRDAALAKAVVVLLPMADWRDAATDLGVTGGEGWASVSPFELAQIASASSFGYLEFR